MKFDLTDNSDDVLTALHDAVAKGLEMCGLTAEGYAKENITANKSVDTGTLRNSITHQVVEDERTVYIGTDVEYAPYVELGTGIYAEGGGGRPTPWVYQDEKGNWHWTRGNVAQPFLAPAAKDHVKEYEAILKEALENG